jgi:hypothetical protein
MYKTTFKDFMEQLYKKPYNQIPKKELKEHANEMALVFLKTIMTMAQTLRH